MRFFLNLLRWFILSNLKEKKTGEMMSVVSIKPLHAFKTHLNFFYETCITFTTKIFFFFFWMSESNLMNYWLNALHQKLMQIFLQHLINIYSFSLLSVYKHNLANLVLILCKDESQTLLTWCSIVQDPRPCSGNILPGGFYDSSPICGQLLSFNPLSLVECLWSSCGCMVT